MCNKLISDITALQPESNPEDGRCRDEDIPVACVAEQMVNLSIALPKLLVLNKIFLHQLHGKGDAHNISKQRIIFCVRRVKSWIQDGASVSTSVRATVFQLLSQLLPLMSDIYGEHWGDILDALAASWREFSELAVNDAPMHRYVTSRRPF